MQYRRFSRRRALSKAEKRLPTFGVAVGGPKIQLRRSLGRLVSLCAQCARGGFVGKIGKRSQVEELVDEFDDRTVLGGLVRDGVDHAVGRDHDGGNARSLVEGGSAGIPGANRRLSVIVEAVGFIVGDDDGALRPVRAAGDGVDLVGQQCLADLRVGVARVIVVAGKVGLDCRAGRARSQAVQVAVAAADIEDSAGAGQRLAPNGCKEVAQALQVALVSAGLLAS